MTKEVVGGKMDEFEAKPAVKPAKKQTWLIVALVLLIVFGGGYLAYAKYGSQILDKLLGNPGSSNSSESASSTSSTKKADESSVDKVTDEGVIWQTPEKLADLGLFAANTAYDGLGGYTGTSYYKVGKTNTGAEIIVAVVGKITIFGGADVHRIIKKNDKYYRIAKNSPEFGEIYNSSKGMENDSDYFLKSLAPEKAISKGETDLVYQFDGGIEPEEGYTTGTKEDEIKWGNLMVEQGANAGDSGGMVKISRYFIKLNDGTKAYYSPKPSFLRDDKTFNLTFTDSTKKVLTFEKIPTSGCGNGAGSTPMVVQSSALADKTEIAASTKGSKLYTFKSETNGLMKYGYGVYTNDSAPGEKAIGKKTITEFVNNYGLVVWIDDYGNAIVYSNTEYQRGVECGKPVIYLYPKQDAQVSVKVGANITKSEPEYGSGWNVLAKPDGSIIQGNTKYDYLFWEGLGWGAYPQVKSGIVVEKSKVSETITNNLTQIGLNQKEISDFKDFWLPKMPDTKFVRLTWFLTKEMDKLAPLAISPKPDSVIRVFLDYAGSNEPINITPQVLSKMPRVGFTAVEWGGLLRK